MNPDPDSTSTTADRTATAQYRAWCRNNGNHQTAGRDHEDWNAKIIWKMRMELEYQWDLVEDEVPEVFSVLLDATKSLLERLKMTIQGMFTTPGYRFNEIINNVLASIKATPRLIASLLSSAVLTSRSKTSSI